jgi:MerR family transcriptional regulator, light-induced transcriptional regulator
MENNVSPAKYATPATPAEILVALGDRIDALDRSGAVALALGAVADKRIGVAHLYTQVLSPYLATICSRWQHGAEQVWQEHFASHVVRTIVEALYPTVAAAAAGVEPRGETVLLVCPPREEHELGLRMLADRFELAGYRSVFLGADTPVSEIIAAGRAVRATIVAMSVSTVFERMELRCFVDSVHEGLPGARLLLGGPAFARDPGAWADDGLLDPSELGLPGSNPVG